MCRVQNVIFFNFFFKFILHTSLEDYGKRG
jgi:hypothetical protein